MLLFQVLTQLVQFLHADLQQRGWIQQMQNLWTWFIQVTYIFLELKEEVEISISMQMAEEHNQDAVGIAAKMLWMLQI